MYWFIGRKWRETINSFSHSLFPETGSEPSEISELSVSVYAKDKRRRNGERKNHAGKDRHD